MQIPPPPPPPRSLRFSFPSRNKIQINYTPDRSEKKYNLKLSAIAGTIDEITETFFFLMQILPRFRPTALFHTRAKHVYSDHPHQAAHCVNNDQNKYLLSIIELPHEVVLVVSLWATAIIPDTEITLLLLLFH